MQSQELARKLGGSLAFKEEIQLAADLRLLDLYCGEAAFHTNDTRLGSIKLRTSVSVQPDDREERAGNGRDDPSCEPTHVVVQLLQLPVHARFPIIAHAA